MLLQAPKSLHYPITVTDLRKAPDDDIERSEVIFGYTYLTTVTEGDEDGNQKEVQTSFVSTFETPIEGKLTSWMIKKGDVLTGPGSPICEIYEPCRHETQYGGMCVECGKDVTTIDYNTSVPDYFRATTTVAHADTALRVSAAEASRADADAKRRLLKARKLSLVVDLDLTIIQATVDPTIGEWQSDPTNPNYESVKDVRSFELFDESVQRNMAYYVKLRPGLLEFLQRISKMYELHIYTMGTKNYAKEIARIVDPEGRLFGDRILSRTDTPGEDVKNLRKLFPVDTRMVVIIDDRVDVWNWSSYLVRVNPYNFFKGIGDINAAFLPKKEDLMAKQTLNARRSPQASSVQPEETQNVDTNGTGKSASEQPIIDTAISMHTDESQANIEQEETLEAQLNERPLAKQQQELEEAEEQQEADGAPSDSTLPSLPNGDTQTSTDSTSTSLTPTISHSSQSPKTRQNLLQDDDTELERIENELFDIHARFYAAFDHEFKGFKDISEVNMEDVPDVKTHINPPKSTVLHGCRICFSGVIPQHIKMKESEYGRTATYLSATLDSEITPYTTHLVTRAGKPTDKMRQAMTRPDMKIVNTNWLFDQKTSPWRRIDENNYVIPKEDMGNDAPIAELPKSVNGSGGLKLMTDIEGDGDIEGDDLGLSPLKETKQEEWDDMAAEIEEMTDDDDDEDEEEDVDFEDEDDEGGSVLSGVPGNENVEPGSIQASLGAGKRKRNDSETASQEDAASSPSKKRHTEMPPSGVNGIDPDPARPEDSSKLDFAGEDEEDAQDDDDEDLEAALAQELAKSGEDGEEEDDENEDEDDAGEEEESEDEGG